MKLLIRPLPTPKESLQQYTLRLAKANGYNKESIARLIKQKSGVSLDKNVINGRMRLKSLIIKLSGHKEVDELFDHKYWYRHQRKVFDFARVKVCPQCLLENGCCTFNWHFRHVLVCDKHSIFLIDSCNSCFGKLSEKSMISMRCDDCGESFVTKKNYKVTKLNRADKYYSPITNINDFHDKTEALRPYFEVYQKGSYKLWAQHYPLSIEELATLIHGALELFENKCLLTISLRLIFEREQGFVSKIPRIVNLNPYLYHHNYKIFTEHFAKSLLILSKDFPSLLLPFSWVGKLYDNDLLGIRKPAYELNSELVYLYKGVYVVPLGKLEEALKVYGVKFN